MSVFSLTLPHTLALFAKYPEPGRVKTRLQPLLGVEGAAQFARQLLHQAVHRSQTWQATMAAQGQPLALCVWVDGGSPSLWDAFWAQTQLQTLPTLPQGAPRCAVQPAGHLGWRMHSAVLAHRAEVPVVGEGQAQPAVVLLGPDAVQFNGEHLQALLAAMQHTPVAYAPAHDGGYVAVAVRFDLPQAALAAMFGQGIAWGSATVLQQSLKALAAHGVVPHCLEAQLDVDEPEDWIKAKAQGWI